MIQINPYHSFVYGNTELKVFHANKGEGLPKHSHDFDHATVCNSGSCLITKENKKLVMTKNTKPVNLVANEWHEIEALEDNTVFINVFLQNNT
jgi:quercetin dioxygenase-like cupin family protein